MLKKYNSKILKKIVNNNFIFSDVVVEKYLQNIETINANVFCPFHEHNFDTPSARLYTTPDGMYILKCFTGECGTHTTYDYINEILVRKYEKYRSVEEFLQERLGVLELETLYKEYEDLISDYRESALDKKIEYIDNVYNETLNLEDYIERLWTA